MKRSIKVVISSLFILSITLLILWGNNYSIVLMTNGYDTDNKVLLESVDNNEELSRIIKAEKDGKPELVNLTRNGMGLWKIEYSVARDEGEPLAISWKRAVGIRRFGIYDGGVFEWEWHYIVCGDDAVAKIDIKEQLPKNVTVNIQQTDSEYILHFVSFSDLTGLRQLQEIIYDISMKM